VLALVLVFVLVLEPPLTDALAMPEPPMKTPAWFAVICSLVWYVLDSASENAPPE
jgi:hypothetical protein